MYGREAGNTLSLVLGSGSYAWNVYAYGGDWCPPGAASSCCIWHLRWLHVKWGAQGPTWDKREVAFVKNPNLFHLL